MKAIYSLLICFFLMAVPFLAMAQADPGGDPGAPIDGGLSILVAAGVGYGVKRYQQNRKKNSR